MRMLPPPKGLSSVMLLLAVTLAAALAAGQSKEVSEEEMWSKLSDREKEYLEAMWDAAPARLSTAEKESRLKVISMGKQLVYDRCALCHRIDVPLKSAGNWGDEQWKKVIQQFLRDSVTEENKSAMAAFMAVFFNKDTPIDIKDKYYSKF